MNIAYTTHRSPSKHNLLSYVQQKYPDIAKEAQQAFIPCKYPLSLIDNIRDEVYGRYGRKISEHISSRHIIYGTIVLIYSRYPVGIIKSHYLHEGVGEYTAKSLGQRPPNVSNYFDEVSAWLKTDCYAGFREACITIRDYIIREHYQ